MIKAGAKKLANSTLGKFGILPTAGGAVVGGGYGAYSDNMTATQGLMYGAGVGAGLGVVGLGFDRAYASYKTSKFINSGNLSPAQQQMARRMGLS